MHKDLDYLHINYEELIEHIKERQPKDSAELTFSISNFLGISDRHSINKIVEVLIELDQSIRKLELLWYAPAGIIKHEIDSVTGDHIASHGLIDMAYHDISFAITA